MSLVTFYQIFNLIDKDTLELLFNTQIGAATLKAGETIKRGEIIGGLDFFRYIGNEMEVDEEQDGTRVIRKVYVK